MNMRGRILAGKADLADSLARAAKPREQWRVGIEHEKFVYRLEDGQPAPFAGAEASLQRLLERLVDEGWAPVRQDATLVGADCGAAAVNLEPGGQLELAGTPSRDLGAVAEELRRHDAWLIEAGRAEGLGFAALGFAPTWDDADMPRVPNQRYAIMARHMPRVGSRGLDMMHRACSIQASYDFADEQDMVRKFRVALALQPVVTALTANSPFRVGAPARRLSHRSWVWAHTDPARCGIPDFVFERDMGYHRYVDWVCSVPVYSLERDGEHLDFTHLTFAELLAGRGGTMLGELSGRDFALQLNAMSPDARLKNVLEMRGADSGDEDACVAVAAMWTGLLYDEDACAACHDRVMSWSASDRARLRHEAARDGLAAEMEGRPLRALAAELLELAAGGLSRSRWGGASAAALLAPLIDAAASGREPASELLEVWPCGPGDDPLPLLARRPLQAGSPGAISL